MSKIKELLEEERLHNEKNDDSDYFYQESLKKAHKEECLKDGHEACEYCSDVRSKCLNCGIPSHYSYCDVCQMKAEDQENEHEVSFENLYPDNSRNEFALRSHDRITSPNPLG